MLNFFEKIIFRVTPKIILRRIIPSLEKYRFFKETLNTQTPITFDLWYNQFVKGHNCNAHWPIHFTSRVINPEKIYCGIETSPGYSPGNYIQAIGEIYIGDYTQIAPNVGIISSNHSLEDNRKHIVGKVYIGKYCWLGMGSIVLPNVKLGDFTVVAAGAVVTKSFDGYCVVGGNPAKVIKYLSKDNCIRHKSKFEYNGYIKNNIFKNDSNN